MTRARDLGLRVGSGTCGPMNAITDVPGVRVGHATLIEGDNIRTGVTVVLPHDETEPLHRPVFAGSFTLNGNGELTGLEWVRDSGVLTTPIGLTNTYAVGTVRDALARRVRQTDKQAPPWVLPVVGETFDGVLNAITLPVITEAAVTEALSRASTRVSEGAVGAGTGTICHGFKGGIGTASRMVEAIGRSYTVGSLVQTNHGRRERLTINGIRVGERIPAARIPVPDAPPGAGSIIVVLATDAPLLPHHCSALARRAALGIGRTGGTGEADSGDLLITFATGNRLPTMAEETRGDPIRLQAVPTAQLDPLYDAAIEATEEAIVNSLVAARTITGAAGQTAYALDHSVLRSAMEV